MDLTMVAPAGARRTYTQRPGDLVPGQPSLAKLLDLFSAKDQSGTTDSTPRFGSVLSCIFQTGHAVSVYAPLEFGHGGDDREHCPAYRYRGIHGLLLRNEIDPQPSKLFQHKDQLLGGTCDSVESKNNHDLKCVSMCISD